MAWGIPVAFMSVVIVPIAGNAGEHVCATVIQTKEKMVIKQLMKVIYIMTSCMQFRSEPFQFNIYVQDILVKIAVGSSTEITMFTVSNIIIFLIMHFKFNILMCS